MEQKNRTISRNSPLYQQAYSMLVQYIIDGYFKQDEKLTDTNLAELLGISRTPVREAVRQLVNEGLLIGSPNKSVVVFTPTLLDIAEIYSLRSSMEGYAARLATLNPNKEVYLRKMESILTDSKSSLKEKDNIKLAKLNTLFHGLIIEASHNSHLNSLSQVIKNKTILCRSRSLERERNMSISVEEHFEILYYISKNSPEEAESIVKSHISQAGLRIINRFNDEIDEDHPVYRMYLQEVDSKK